MQRDPASNLILKERAHVREASRDHPPHLRPPPPPAMSIRVERPEPGIVTVTIDSPTTVNAITQSMMVELANVFKGLAEDKSVRAVVLTGACQLVWGLDATESHFGVSARPCISLAYRSHRCRPSAL